MKTEALCLIIQNELKKSHFKCSLRTNSGVTRGGRPGLWPRARSEKLEKSHTKGRKIFFKGRLILFTGV